MGVEEERDPYLLISVQHRISICYDSPWITFMHARMAHARTWRGVVMVDALVVDGMCDVSAGLQRGCSCQGGPSAVKPVLSVHNMTVLWPSGLQLLGSNDCNGDSSGGGSLKK